MAWYVLINENEEKSWEGPYDTEVKAENFLNMYSNTMRLGHIMMIEGNKFPILEVMTDENTTKY